MREMPTCAYASRRGAAGGAEGRDAADEGGWEERGLDDVRIPRARCSHSALEAYAASSRARACFDDTHLICETWRCAVSTVAGTETPRG